MGSYRETSRPTTAWVLRTVETIRPMQQIDFHLRGEYITLDNLLKVTGATSSGATAKQSVAGGLVKVDGQQELRKTAKIRAGQSVQFSAGGQGLHIRVLPEVDDSARGLP